MVGRVQWREKEGSIMQTYTCAFEERMVVVEGAHRIIEWHAKRETRRAERASTIKVRIEMRAVSWGGCVWFLRTGARYDAQVCS